MEKGVCITPRCELKELFKRTSFGVVISLCLLLFFLASCTEAASEVSVAFTNPDGSKTPSVSTEVVATSGKRRKGLMYRKELAANAGMFFVFPRETALSFWMKNTYLELDMIFINSNLEVVSIVHRAVPLSLTKRPSGKPAQYVLEVIGGSAKKWGLVPGSKIEISGTLPVPR